MIIPLLLAGMVGYCAWWSWDRFALRYSPDFELYTQGGLGLYPSPIGRLLGALGADVFVALSIAAAACIVLLVWQASGTSWAAAAIAFSPVTLYLSHAGIDPIGLWMFTAALAGRWPRVMLPAAALTHWSLLPFVLFELARTKGTWAQRALILFFLGGATSIVLVVTPYGGVVAGLLDEGFLLAFAQGLVAGLLIATPALLLFRQRPAHVFVLLLGAFECGVQQHLQARYLLPAAVFIVCTGELRPRITLLGDIACKRWADVISSSGAWSSGVPGGSSTGKTTTAKEQVLR